MVADLQALRDSTRALQRAAESADPELIDRAIDDRERAVAAVVEQLAGLPATERAGVVATIAAEADDAEAALVRLAGAGREALALQRGHVRAITGYGPGHDGSAPALDRAT